MAKTLEEAIGLFRQGKSPRECEKLTGINYKKIDREAKKLGITKGDLSQLTSSIVRNTSDFVSLPVSDQDAVRQEVCKQLEGMQFYQENARKVVKIGMVAFSKDPTPLGMKNTLEAMKVGMIVEGLVPFHPSAPVINNTNAQQNVSEHPVAISDDPNEAIKQYQKIMS